MNIRESNELLEEKVFSRFATLSKNSKGRQNPEKKCDIRTDFQRDRDRIVHSKSFRRLKDKTQVFISPEGDHYRTRLVHTLEVSQIARTVAKSLMLNEDLTEAIALGHDLGHAPFGHKGESVLNDICVHGFSHESQSLRIVDVLENDTGLNLTYEVRDGIKNHSFGAESLPITLEGQIVRYADKIAYINHDIDDSLRAGLISSCDLPSECKNVLGDSYSLRIDTMIKSLIEASIGKNMIDMTQSVKDAMLNTRKFMFEKIYLDKYLQCEDTKIVNIISGLYDYFKKNPKSLPLHEQERLKIDDIDRVVCDYIAGMTDNYVVKVFENYFLPKRWQI